MDCIRNNSTSIIIIIMALLVLVYAYKCMRTSDKNNTKKEQFNQELKTEQEDTKSLASENSDPGNEQKEKVYGDYITTKDRHYTKYEDDNISSHEPNKDSAPKEFSRPEYSELSKKFYGRNKATNGYKKSSYSGSVRGNLGVSDWADYFDNNNNIVTNSQTGDNDKFLPIDQTNGGFAVFKSGGRTTCGSNQNCEPEDLFNADNYLPQEVNDDWFEVQKEPISVKNRHLVNITRPIGVDTIGSSKRNSGWDLRAPPANPKFVVSPWLQSVIDPNINLKPIQI